MPTEPYEEIIEGVSIMRAPPDERHETINQRIRSALAATQDALDGGKRKMLATRSIVSVSPGTMLRPDVAIVGSPSNKLWLAIEIISSLDHHQDTVVKKEIYETYKLSHLWIIDPRYDNVEVYSVGAYGLALRKMLARRDTLEDDAIPGFRYSVAALFDEG